MNFRELFVVAASAMPLYWGRAKKADTVVTVVAEDSDEAPRVDDVVVDTVDDVSYDEQMRDDINIRIVSEEASGPVFVSSEEVTRGFEGFVQIKLGDNLSRIAQLAGTTYWVIMHEAENEWLLDQTTEREKATSGLALVPKFSGTPSTRGSGGQYPAVYVRGNK
jgi:hypothetical protein